MRIPIEVSARHIHLSQKDADKLFGIGFKFKKLKDLSQPGEFATKSVVTLKTRKGELSLRVLMSVRERTQVELSRTDSYKLKINPPIRVSGNHEGSVGGTLIGSKGKVILKSGIIIAQRHMHCDPENAKKLGVRNNQKISVKTVGDRSLTFHNVVVRVSQKYDCGMHVDVDEGNAGLPGGVCNYGMIIQ